MYDDFAMLDINKFETVAREYASSMKISSLTTESEDVEKICNKLNSLMLELYNVSNNTANKQKIKSIQNQLLIIAKQEFNIQLKQETNKPKFMYCDYIKLIIKETLTLMCLINKNEKAVIHLKNMCYLVVDLLGECSLRKY